MLNRRSNAFEEYLRRQTPQRRSELIAAEKRYAASHAAHLKSYEDLFVEMLYGYEDPAAGPVESRPEIADVYMDVTGAGGGDWSWKPHRDRVLGDRFCTFRGVPPSGAELSHSTCSPLL